MRRGADEAGPDGCRVDLRTAGPAELRAEARARSLAWHLPSAGILCALSGACLQRRRRSHGTHV